MAVSTTSISEDSYESLKSPDRNEYSTMGVTSHNSSGAKSTVKSGKSPRPFRLAAVGLGLLCAILLTATIGLCVLYMNCKDYRGQLQRDNINLSNEKSQLQRDYNKLSNEKNQLQGNCTRLSNEKDQLQRDYNSHIGQCRTCPEGWEQLSSKCYYFSDYTIKKNWEDSRKYCKLQGADLVIINSQEEQEFIIQHTKTTLYWIGLKYAANGLFEWVDGTALQQAFWRPGYPKSQGHCVTSGYIHQFWIDEQCNKLWGLICETDASCVCNKKLSK